MKIFTSIFHDLADFSDRKMLCLKRKRNFLQLCVKKKKDESKDTDALRNFPLLDQSPETVITLQRINLIKSALKLKNQ